MVGFDVNSLKDLTSFEYSLAGGIAGFASRFLSQPLDVVKIRLQLQVEPISHNAWSKYGGILHCVSSIVREEGLQSLWKGHVPAQYLSIVFSGTQFWTYEVSTKFAHANLCSQAPNLLVNFFCGAVAGCSATVVSMPLDMVRTRLVAQNEPKTLLTFRHAVKSIFLKEKFYSFYRGFFPAILQVFPHADPEKSSKVQIFICGGMAGLFAKTLVYPLDLTKKRLQIQGFSHARKGLGKTPTFSGLVDCLMKTVRYESIFGLYKGLYPSLLKAFFSTACHFFFYEQAIEFLSDNKTRKRL